MASPRPDQRAPLGPTLALIATLAAAAFGVLMPLVMGAIEPTALPPPFPPQNQRAETLSYLLAYVVILPAAIIAGRRLADAIAGGPHAAALPALTGLLAAALAAAVVAVRAAGRLAERDGLDTVLIAGAVWWVAAAALLAVAARPRAWPPLLALAPHAALAWALAAVAALVALLCFAVLGSVSIPALVLGAVAAGAATAAHALRRSAALPRGWGIAADVVAIVALLAAVPDLVIFRPEDAAADPVARLETSIFQFHQNLLLGPANEVLHGHAMLTGTASQYGVTSIYGLAAWFQVAPIGYGTFGLLAGALAALWFAAGYVILRLAGCSRPLAAAALAVGVVALAYNLTFPIGALPQSGPLRFGLPMAIVLAAVAGERFPRHARAARLAALGCLGLSAVWALEAFAYSAVVFAALAGMRAWLGGGRLARDALEAVLAVVAAHALFAAVTLAAAGELPDWGEYLAYLREFLFGDLGDLTYDVARWTPALAVGIGYAASAAALAELARRGGPPVARERTALVAIAGMTAYGIALLSYYVDRSQDHILIHVALPALICGALWLGLLLRAGLPAPARIAALGLALAVAVLLTAVGWSGVDPRFPRTALALAAPGGDSLGAALDRLWHPPPLAPAAPAGERALARHMPGERASLVLTTPDLGLEILLRSGRVDRLLLGDPWETSFVAESKLPELRARVDALRPGTRMLVDEPARRVLARLRADRRRDPFARPLPDLAPLQQWALRRIDERFRLRPVAPAAGGFTVLELAPRS